jgi:hypothetical protein
MQALRERVKRGEKGEVRRAGGCSGNVFVAVIRAL